MLRSVGIHDPQVGLPLVLELVDVLPRVHDARAVGRDLRVADALPIEPVLGGEQRLGSDFLRAQRDDAGRGDGGDAERNRQLRYVLHQRSPILPVLPIPSVVPFTPATAPHSSCWSLPSRVSALRPTRADSACVSAPAGTARPLPSRVPSR